MIGEEENRIIEWLEAPDVAGPHLDAQTRRCRGTGDWLLQDTRYKDWVNGPGQTLWLLGIRTSSYVDHCFSWIADRSDTFEAGCGKSILW